jgi:hypothetical protein
MNSIFFRTMDILHQKFSGFLPVAWLCVETSLIMWWILSVTWDRSVVFVGYSGFLHQQNWPQRYDCNIVIKHHEPTFPFFFIIYEICIIFR